MTDDQFVIWVEDDLCLELLRPEHAEELFSLTEKHRQYLRRWLPWLDNNKYLQNTVDFIKYSRKQYKDSTSMHLAISSKDSIVGIIGFHKVDWINHSTSIGYWLVEDYQGRGIVTKSCKSLIDYAFGSLGMNRVEIRCAVENSRSRAIPERLGFMEEGVAREAEWLYDRYVDHAVYAMLRSEWEGEGDRAKKHKKNPPKSR